ncbi:unnamed protein product, partial [Brassica rapa]
TSVCVRQHTQDVRGCPCVSVSTHRILSISTHISMLYVCGCLWLSASTHKMSVCVHQHTQDVRVCLSAHTGHPLLSISTHISTLV